MIYIKVCPICGKEFKTTKTKVKYCSSVCACESKSIKALKYVKRVQHEPKTCEECRKAGAKEALNKKTSMHTQNYYSEKKETKVRSDYPDVPSSKRWEKMSLAERNAESRKYHLTYGQAQGRAYCGTLPETFGEVKKSENTESN